MSCTRTLETRPQTRDNGREACVASGLGTSDQVDYQLAVRKYAGGKSGKPNSPIDLLSPIRGLHQSPLVARPYSFTRRTRNLSQTSATSTSLISDGDAPCISIVGAPPMHRLRLVHPVLQVTFRCWPIVEKLLTRASCQSVPRANSSNTNSAPRLWPHIGFSSRPLPLR